MKDILQEIIGLVVIICIIVYGYINTNIERPSDTNNTKSNGFLCKIGANASHKFLLTMWIEGTDPDCKLGDGDDTDITLETNLSLSISLYALSSAKN